MCSSTVADPANMSRQGSTLCSPAVGKSSAVLFFEAVTYRQSAPDSPKRKWELRGRNLVSTLLPRRGARHVPAAVGGVLQLRFSEKPTVR